MGLVIGLGLVVTVGLIYVIGNGIYNVYFEKPDEDYTDKHGN